MKFNKVGRLFISAVLVSMLIACGETDQKELNANHLARAKAYAEQGQYKAATIEYKNAVKKSGGEASSIVQYAEMLIKLGQYDAALSLLEQVSTDKDESYYVALVESYQGKHKYLSAELVLDEHLSGNSVELQMLRAHNLLGLNELEQAVNAYQKILNDEAGNDLATLGKATALVRSNQVKESKDLLNSIPKGAKAFSKARILLAGIAIGEQNLEQAEDILTDLLSTMDNTDIIEPEKAVVLERLSYVLTRQGRSNEAYIYTKLLSEAFPGSNEVKEKYQLAVEKMQAGELDASKATLIEILNDYPSYKLATQLLGIISYLEGDNTAASKYLSESVDPEVANEMTRHIYAATNLKMNEPKKVLEILEPTIDRSKAPETLALYGLAAISDGQYKKGENALLKALSFDEKNIRVRLALADYYRSGPGANKGKEWQQLDQSYQLDSSDLQLLRSIVSFHLRHDGAKKAEEFIASALKAKPRDYATNLVAGYFSLNQRNISTALKRFTMAAEVNKEGEGYLNALFAKGKAEISLSKGDSAKQTFNEIIRVFPESELGYKGLLSVYLIEDQGAEGRSKLEFFANSNAQLAPYYVLIQESISQQNVSDAKAYLEKAKAAHGEDGKTKRLGDGIKYVEALIAMRKSDFATARTKVAEVLTSEPDNMRLLSFLVDLELKAGRVNEAEKVLGQIEAINDSHPVVNILRGDIALSKNDYSTARKLLMQSWGNAPVDSTAEKLYRVLGVLGDKPAQSKFLQDWLTKLPNSTPALMYQSLAYQQRGQRIKAVEGYEKVLKLAPNNVMALNNLGWIYFEKKDARALELLAKAVELAPESPAVLDSYGWALVDNGKVSEGLPYLEKAHKLAPEMEEIEEHLNAARAKQ